MDGRVANLKTVKSCENFARNALKRNFLELADQAWLRAAELRREEYQRGGRRPDVDYHIIGLKNGATIYLPDVDVKATIASHRTFYLRSKTLRFPMFLFVNTMVTVSTMRMVQVSTL